MEVAGQAVAGAEPGGRFGARGWPGNPTPRVIGIRCSLTCRIHREAGSIYLSEPAALSACGRRWRWRGWAELKMMNMIAESAFLSPPFLGLRLRVPRQPVQLRLFNSDLQPPKLSVSSPCRRKCWVLGCCARRSWGRGRRPCSAIGEGFSPRAAPLLPRLALCPHSPPEPSPEP